MYFKYFLVFGFLVLVVNVSAKKKCDKTKCPGPLSYYDEINCEALYKNEDDCCPSSYDCSNLDDRSSDKCYVKGQVYNSGDKLNEKDAPRCHFGCTCTVLDGKNAKFVCAVASCAGVNEPGCYADFSKHKCCGEKFCPNATQKVATCVVNGKTYKQGEYFELPKEPEKECICLPGYKGKNIEPFCRIKNCGSEIFSGTDIKNKCAPAYYPKDPNNQKSVLNCNYDFKCKNENDFLIKGSNPEKPTEQNTCKLGDLTMKIGDRLRTSGSDYFSKCLRCSCEVPPTPTCKYLPKKECDEDS